MVPNESFYDDKNVRYQGITVVLRGEKTEYIHTCYLYSLR